jgi:GNAT superfamily N-acetyltransferase
MPTLQLPQLKYVKDFQNKNSEYVLIQVDTAKLDAAWSRDDGFYIPPGGPSDIGNRRERFEEWLKNNPDTPVEAPFVGWNSFKNCVSFTNGRHRFSVLRDLGYPTVCVTVAREDLKNMKPFMATGKTAADEFLDYGKVKNILQSMMVDVEGSLPTPELKIANHARYSWNGRCTWRYGEPNTLIEVQKAICYDEDRLRRTLAHELCHHEAFLHHFGRMNHATYNTMYRIEGGHGATWLKIAARWNAKYGADYVTVKSDNAGYDVRHDDASFYILLWNSPRGIRWQSSLSLSAKAIKFMWGLRDKDAYKLCKSTDRTLLSKFTIGGSWGYSLDPAVMQTAEELFANGTNVFEQEVASHFSEGAKKTKPFFVLIHKQQYSSRDLIWQQATSLNDSAMWLLKLYAQRRSRGASDSKLVMSTNILLKAGPRIGGKRVGSAYTEDTKKALEEAWNSPDVMERYVPEAKTSAKTAAPIGEVGTPDFKSWFAGSKIVTTNGRPKLVYHGTSANDFESFNIPAYFSDDLKYTKDFGSRTVRAYLNIKNPLYLDVRNKATSREEDPLHIEETLIRKPEWRAQQRAKGYDGVVITDFDGKDYNLHVFLPFNAEQIWIADQGESKYGSTNFDIRPIDWSQSPEALRKELTALVEEGYVWVRTPFPVENEYQHPGGKSFSTEFHAKPLWDEGITEMVDVHTLRTFQPQVTAQGILYYLEDPSRLNTPKKPFWWDEFPVIVDGLIHEGNHRATAAWVLGEALEATVVRLPAEEEQKPVTYTPRPKPIFASPDFGYSTYNNRENDLNKVKLIPQSNSPRGEGAIEITAEYDGRQIGGIDCWVVSRQCTVNGIYIEGDWRGTGLGQMLYDAAIQAAKKAGCRYFRSDGQLRDDAVSAWQRLAKRYRIEEVDNPDYLEGVEEEDEDAEDGYSTFDDGSVQQHPVVYQIDLNTVPLKPKGKKATGSGDPFWERLKADMLAGIVYHGTTLEIAEIIQKRGFRGLDFDAIVQDVLGKYGLTEAPTRMRKVLEMSKESYAHEDGLVSTCPGGQVPTLYAGGGGEVPKQIEAFILGKYSTRDVTDSRIKGQPAVIKCRIRTFEGSEHQRRAKQMVDGLEKWFSTPGESNRNRTPRKAAEDIWQGYTNFLCKPEELEVISVITGSELQQLAKAPLGVSHE